MLEILSLDGNVIFRSALSKALTGMHLEDRKEFCALRNEPQKACFFQIMARVAVSIDASRVLKALDAKSVNS